jgi:hypothetical protein
MSSSIEERLKGHVGFKKLKMTTRTHCLSA